MRHGPFDDGATIIAELTRERDRLRETVADLRSKLERMRAQHEGEQRLREQTEADLSIHETAVDEHRVLRQDLLGRYDRLVAEENRLRRILQQLEQ